jgi:hypothetical protein
MESTLARKVDILNMVTKIDSKVSKMISSQSWEENMISKIWKAKMISRTQRGNLSRS